MSFCVSLLLLLFSLTYLGANLGGIRFAALIDATVVPFLMIWTFSDRFLKATETLFDPGLI